MIKDDIGPTNSSSSHEKWHLLALEEIAESRISRAPKLNMSGYGLMVIPQEISELVWLEELSIGVGRSWNVEYDATNDKSPWRIGTSSQNSLAALGAITELHDLKRLRISGWGDLINFDGIAGLNHLEVLEVSSCEKLYDISALAGCPSLREVHLTECPSLVEIDKLADLKGVTFLNLAHNGNVRSIGIHSLPPLLKELKIELLVYLESLVGIGAHTTIERLGIKECHSIKSLDPLRKLSHLKDLSIHDCWAIDDLSALCDIPSLRCLSIHGNGKNGTINMPPDLPRADLELRIDDQIILNLGDELFASGRRKVYRYPGKKFKNYGPALAQHFAELRSGSAELREVKLFMLGNGRSGKSSLVRALQNVPHQHQEQSTHGIRHWRWSPSVLLQGDEEDGPQTVDVNIWDFGGQQIYHELHRLFMGTRAVFVLLWNPWENEWKLDPENPDDPAEFQDDEYHPLEYWLDQIHAYSRLRKPQIILVRNFMDKDKAYADKYKHRAPNSWKDVVSDRYRDAENIHYVEFSAAERDTPLGRKRMAELRLAIDHSLNEQMRQLMSRYIPKGRYDLRQKLAGWVKEGVNGEGDPKNVRTLSYGEFDALVAEHCTVNGTHDTPKVLRFLNDIGALYYNERMPEKVVLDQRWAIDAFYTILAYGAAREEVRRAGGRFTLAQLVRWGWKRYTADEQFALLGMMEQCGVAVPFRSAERSAKGEQEYLAPSLLSTWQDPLVRLLAENFPRAANCLRATVQHNALGSEVLMAVLGEVAQRFGDEGVYWRHGFRLRTADGLHAHVEWSPLKEFAYGGLLLVEVAGSNTHEREGFLTMLRGLFQRNSNVLQEEDWVVERMAEGLETTSPTLTAEDLAWSADQLQRISPRIEYRERLSVGISYAGAGDAPRIVSALTRNLRPALAALGVDLIDYRNLESEALDDTRRVINAVANSHLVLIFRDEHYLRSIPCLCELLGAYEAEPKGTFKRDRVKVVQLSNTRYFADAELERWAQDADRWWLNLRNLLGGDAARDSTVTKLAMEKREYPWFALADSRENLARFNEFIKNHNTHVKPPVSLDDAELERWTLGMTEEVVRVMEERWMGGG